MVLDPKMRNLAWYGVHVGSRAFVQLDPIGILKSYVDNPGDLRRQQISML